MPWVCSLTCAAVAPMGGGPVIWLPPLPAYHPVSAPPYCVGYRHVHKGAGFMGSCSAPRLNTRAPTTFLHPHPTTLRVVSATDAHLITRTRVAFEGGLAIARGITIRGLPYGPRGTSLWCLTPRAGRVPLTGIWRLRVARKHRQTFPAQRRGDVPSSSQH